MAKPVKWDIRRNDTTALNAFAALNIAWIKQMHYVEPSDQYMVDHPEIYIQDDNSIFTAHIDDMVAGACALKQDEHGQWELTKMAVDSRCQGQGIGQALLEAVETHARNHLGLKRIYLLSNTGNETAIRLYKRNHWVINHSGQHQTYARCNIGMEKYL